MEKLGAIVVGGVGTAGRGHVATWLRVPNVKVTAIVDPNESGAKKVCNQYLFLSLPSRNMSTQVERKFDDELKDQTPVFFSRNTCRSAAKLIYCDCRQIDSREMWTDPLAGNVICEKRLNDYYDN